MAKPYDATTKRLLELRPADWIAFLGLPLGAVSLLDADLSTVTAAADRLIRVDAPSPYLSHSEMESGKDTGGVPFRLLQYSVGAKAKYGLPVVSTVFLLHKASDSPKITGIYEEIGSDGAIYLTFLYRVVRIWELDSERLLTGGLGLLPFAPIGNVTPDQLPAIIRRMEARIEAEAISETEAGDFWVATYVLLGLRYNKAFNAQLLQGVRRMKESVTYQAILEEGEEIGLEKGRTEGRFEGQIEGELREARRLVLRAGTKRFGDAPVSVSEQLERITTLETLEALLDRVFEVETWEEWSA